ncbi:MAG: hypothetical protein PHF67_00915 [Candidatus Nanoarchaeia archaeon]|nr:hypothetical protein [Candidatus Nanoarchaeia archaeon]
MGGSSTAEVEFFFVEPEQRRILERRVDFLIEAILKWREQKYSEGFLDTLKARDRDDLDYLCIHVPCDPRPYIRRYDEGVRIS